jgi:hypothetical protein
MVLSNEPLVAVAAQGLIRIRALVAYDGKDFSFNQIGERFKVN